MDFQIEKVAGLFEKEQKFEDSDGHKLLEKDESKEKVSEGVFSNLENNPEGRLPVSPLIEKFRNHDIDALMEKISEGSSHLDLSKDEIGKFGDILRDNRNNGAMYGRSFGSCYGGMVCICGSINCTGCYGPLISNKGICRNA